MKSISTDWADRVLFAIFVAAAISLSSCATAGSGSGAEGYVKSFKVHSGEFPRGLAWSGVRHNIAKRFPGAVILRKDAFAESIAGKHFRFRKIGDDIVTVYPGEYYSEDGRYSTGHRVISGGTYSFGRGVLSIECVYCPESFMGLRRKRVFFRHDGKLLMTSVDGRGGVIELIPSS